MLRGQRNCYRNIKGEPQIYGSLPSRPCLVFPLGVVFMVRLANSSCMPNLMLLVSAIAQISKGNPKFWGAPRDQGQTHFSYGCDFMMGFGKPKFEVTSLSHRANIEGEPPNFGELPSPGPYPILFCI